MEEQKKEEEKKIGRPSGFVDSYIKMVDVYLNDCKDSYNKLGQLDKVKLPTVDGFAVFIGVARSSVFKWANENKPFSDSLDKIKIEQKERLLNSGLSGDYNSTIAKLVLSSNHGMTERQDNTSGDKPIESKTTVVFKDFSEKNGTDTKQNIQTPVCKEG